MNPITASDRTHANGKRGCTRIATVLAVVFYVALLGICFSFANSFRNTLRARYSWEAIPLIGHVRVKTELYRMEHGRLPGTSPIKRAADTDGDSDSQVFSSADSRIDEDAAAGAYAQSFSATGLVFQIDQDSWKACNKKQTARHFAKLIDITHAELYGKFLKPEWVQYLAHANRSAGDHVYTIGVFGSEPPALGTGYAVVEVVNAAYGHKSILTWERYFPLGERQTVFWVQPMETPYDPQDPAFARICPIPRELLNPRSVAELDAALAVMHNWGWNREILEPGTASPLKIKVAAYIYLAFLVVLLFAFGISYLIRLLLILFLATIAIVWLLPV